VSNVVQQGDCNASATFQRLMTSIFRDTIGRYNHAYLDDLFPHSNSIEEHEKHLRVVFTRLRENKLHLKWSKCNLYAKNMECLGHIIDDNGIHPDVDKLQRIRDWRTPRNYLDIQQFVGLVNYVANFLPDVTAYTAPLQAMTQNQPLQLYFYITCHNYPIKGYASEPVFSIKEIPIWQISLPDIYHLSESCGLSKVIKYI
jgi:hypothetical protein